MYFAMRELEQELSSKGTKVKGVTKAAEAIGNRALELLKQSVPNVEQAPDTWTAVGFQVVGYEGSTPRTINVEIGKQVKTEVFDGLGCTRTGQSQSWMRYGRCTATIPKTRQPTTGSRWKTRSTTRIFDPDDGLIPTVFTVDSGRGRRDRYRASHAVRKLSMDQTEATSPHPRREAMKEKEQKASREPFITISHRSIVRMPFTINSPSQPRSVNSAAPREGDEPILRIDTTPRK